MDKNFVNQIVEQYNEVEKQQTARLSQLFDLMNAGQGWRYVKFRNDVM